MFEYFICWMDQILIDIDEITGKPMYLEDFAMREVSRTEAAAAINAGIEVRVKMVRGRTNWRFCHIYGDRLVCDELPF